MDKNRIKIFCLLVFTLFFTCVAYSETKKFKVLVVMSYETTYRWCSEIKEGVDHVLGKSSEIKYFYMNTKIDVKGGPKKAKEAFEVFEKFKPDGVIVADDNGQSMFVVPYVKDKYKTPVMFCGVNAEPEKYGYPSKNVSGILERQLIKESIIFIQQLLPNINTMGFVIRQDSSTAAGISAQIDREKKGYPVKVFDTVLLNNIKEGKNFINKNKKKYDALFMVSLEGLPDENGKPMTEKNVIKTLKALYKKPTLGIEKFGVQYGSLCAIIQTGQEQGTVAAEMLLKAMKGTPVAKIPITRNKFGKRVINMDTLNSLKLKPDPKILSDAELVRTEK